MKIFSIPGRYPKLFIPDGGGEGGVESIINGVWSLSSWDPLSFHSVCWGCKETEAAKKSEDG